MTVSIRRMTLGSGYRYLMESVAQSDGAGRPADALTAYYAETGTPPGRFLGAGLAGLGCGAGIPAGSQVTEEHLWRMLGMLQDPLTGEQLGSRPPLERTRYAERLQNRIHAETAGLSGPERTAAVARIKAEEAAKEAKRPKTVAGFDLTFSAPKSVSVAWALAAPETRAAIYRAHQQALEYVIGYAEQCVFTSRSGKGGVVQEEVKGIVGAAFDHWDSRTGDPQLHTHVVVMNRAQTMDGKWRTLDSRGMFKATVALSEMYNAVLSDYLTVSLAWGWDATARRRSATPKYEVAGVPEKLREEFSTRTAAVEQALADLVPAFAAAHGRAPTSREMLQLRQQATLSTRPDKHVHSLSELIQGWRTRATPFVGADPVTWVSTLANRNDLPLLHSGDLADPMLLDVAKVAVHTVAEKRATFSRANVLAETLRQFHGVRFACPDERLHAVQRTVTLALEQVLLITPPELTHTPAQFTRPDGTSRFRARGFELYTTQDLLDAEARLLDAGRDTTGPIAPAPAPILEAAGGHPLAPDQATVIEQIATSGRILDVLVGPAGTGKSVTTAGLRAVWEQQHGAGSVIGLAPSAAAAQVLADELGTGCENTAKWLVEHTKNTERLAQIDQLRAGLHQARTQIRANRLRHRIHQLARDVDTWQLHAGQLVIIDEASLAGTFTLDTIATHARQVGAKLVLVGDWAQLSPVEAGGAFHLLTRDRHPAPELAQARRFTHDWEKHASTRLRHGDTDVLDDYTAHGRITGGDREEMLDAIYTAWRADIGAGRSALMVAPDLDTVTELNARARADRVLTGQVSACGIHTDDQVTIGVGDHVVTRRNDRRLATGRGWVKNGDEWQVTGIDPAGNVTVTRAGRGDSTGGTVTLPAEYAREHLELAYATTAYRAQGRTVDRAHAFVTATTGREVLYVAATRGREDNRLYVDTAYDPDLDTAHTPPVEQSPTDVLGRVLANRVADTSATETIEQTWREQHSIARVWAEYATIAGAALKDRYDGLLASSGLSPQELHAAQRSDAYGPLLAALRDAEARGLDVDKALPRLVQGRSLDTADDVAAVLHGRLDRWTRAATPRTAVPRRIAGLFPTAPPVADADLQRALEERAALIRGRARELAMQALEHHHPWTTRLGRLPQEAAQREPWLRHLDTIAAYRDRWGVTGGSVLGPPPTSKEQEAQRRTAETAARAALTINQDTRTVSGVGQPLERTAGMEGVER